MLLVDTDCVDRVQHGAKIEIIGCEVAFILEEKASF